LALSLSNGEHAQRRDWIFQLKLRVAVSGRGLDSRPTHLAFPTVTPD